MIKVYKYKRHTKLEIEQRLRRVEELYNQGLNCREISEETKIAYSTVCKYLEKVTSRRKSERAELEVMNTQGSLQDRALRILRKYQDLAKICNEIKQDKSKSAYDRTQAGKLEISCLNNVYEMLKHPPLNVMQKDTKAGDSEIK